MLFTCTVERDFNITSFKYYIEILNNVLDTLLLHMFRCSRLNWSELVLTQIITNSLTMNL